MVPEDELTFSVARSGGPGGQHVNKTSTKVLVRFDLAGSRAFTPEQKERLARRLPPRYLTNEGEVLIASEEHRDQLGNRVACREKLAAALRGALARPKRRRATKPTRASKERRIKAKKERGERKRQRRDPSD